MLRQFIFIPICDSEVIEEEKKCKRIESVEEVANDFTFIIFAAELSMHFEAFASLEDPWRYFQTIEYCAEAKKIWNWKYVASLCETAMTSLTVSIFFS